MMTREQVERLRERYPVGSRVELHEMPDDPCPIESGAKGELLYIDDGGTPHIKWDNERSLGTTSSLSCRRNRLNGMAPTLRAGPIRGTKPSAAGRSSSL